MGSSMPGSSWGGICPTCWTATVQGFPFPNFRYVLPWSLVDVNKKSHPHHNSASPALWMLMALYEGKPGLLGVCNKKIIKVNKQITTSHVYSLGNWTKTHIAIFPKSSSLEPLFAQNNEILDFILTLLWIYSKCTWKHFKAPRVKQIQISLE